MTRIHTFGDEAGNFDFSRRQGASRYFILTTVTFFDDRQAGLDLQNLRYQLAWDGIDHLGPFHSADDRQEVRDRVYRALEPHRFRIDATILEKAKVHPKVRTTDERFCQYAWSYHMKYVTPQIADEDDELMVVTASMGYEKKRRAFYRGVRKVMNQVAPDITIRTASWRAEVDCCLQVADYCSWAIQRKWERDDDRSHVLIRDRIDTEFDLFARDTQLYY